MRLPKRNQQQSGAVSLEGLVIFLVFLTLCLGMLDLGIGVFQYHLVSEAARQGARLAIVHGQMAPTGWNGGAWGPSTINEKANATGVPLVTAIQPYLVGIDLSQATIKAQWLDGGNAPEQRVSVTVTATYQPSIAYIFSNTSYTLSATSTMPIAH
jgi:Flp pilus assembly protein TadG